MGEQARLFETIPTAEEQAADDREHELDRTPRGVVRQALDRLLSYRWSTHFGRRLMHVDDRPIWRESDSPLRILDWCAGSGVWSSEMRAWCERHSIPVHITAVELRECERECLDRWCDKVHIEGDCGFLLRTKERFDLALGNPYFSGLIDGLPRVLACSTAALILHTSETPQRTVEGNKLAAAHPPVRELAIPGSVRFRGAGTGADSRSYSVSAWVRGAANDGHGWPREILPLLPPEQRGWVEPPGAERVILPSWPTRPGWVQP